MKLSTICYLDNGHQLLLLKRDKQPGDIHAGKYVSVGGKFEAGETPEACAKREIYEETGLIAEDLTLRGFITFPDFRHDGEDWYSFVYTVESFSGKMIPECDEGTLEWVDYEEVPNKPTWAGDYLFMDWIRQDKPFFSAQFTYDEAGELLDHSVVFYETKEGMNEINL